MKRKSTEPSSSQTPAKQRKTVAKAVSSKTVKKASAKTKAVKKASAKTKAASSKANKTLAKKTTVKKTVKAKAKPKTKASPKKKATPAKKASPKKGKATQKATPKKKAAQKKKATPKKKAPAKKKTATPKKKGQAAKKKVQKPASKAAQKKDGPKKPKVHPNEKLTPNNAIEVAKKDLMFEQKNGQGTLELSSLGKAKTAIQAVLTNDIPLLEKLIKNTNEIPSLFVARSVDNKEDALCAALRVKNKAAIQLLLKELEDVNQGKTRLVLGTPSLEKENTGRYNYRSLGHAVRGINVARGGREGNDAFTKDVHSYRGRTHISQYVGYAVENVKDMAVLRPFLQSSTHSDQFQNNLLDHIWQFARQGAHKITGELVKLAFEKDGYGFNKLHMEVLTCSKPSELSQFRSVSVKKKPYDNQKITPLHLSAINPNPDIMLSLLAVVPEFYIVDKNGYGLIHYAAACEGSGPLEALVARGVFPNQATTMGLTPLMIASRLGRIQNMIFLLKPRKTIPLPGIMKEVRFVDSVMGSKTSLHFAAENGQAEACRLLIDNGANIEAITSAATNKLTPIMMAARSGHFKTVKTLVDAKASLDAKDKLKRTPLTHAVMNGNYVIASFLLRKGADPNSKDTSGNTPIHYAAGYGWWHCVKLLLKAGADPNSMNEWKVPPLSIAFLKGHSDCADVLIREAGVGVDFRDAEGWTMVMMTVSKPVNDETLKQLKFLVEDKKANVKLVDGDGWNAMHHLASSPVQGYNEASKKKQFETIIECAQILIKHGCDISAKTVSGETPVNIVMQQDPIKTDLLQLLLNKGASISLNAGGEDGETVLHLMARKVVHGDQCQVFDLIWKQSAKADGNSLIDLIDVKDKSGFTPLLRLAETYREKTSNSQQQPSSWRFGYHSYSNITPVKDDFYGHVMSLLKRFVEKGQADINYAIAADNNKATPEDRARGAVLFYFIYPYNNLPQSDSNGVKLRNNVLKAFLSFKPKVNIHNKKGTTPLIEVLTYGTVGEEAAKILIGAGADVRLIEALPQEKDESETEDSSEKKQIEPASPIFVAAKNSLFVVMKKLLADGASPVSPNKKNNVLHHLSALKSSPTEVVKCLAAVLNKGVAVNVQDGKKRTPLHYAVEALTQDSTTDVVDFLLEKGADPLIRDEDGRLPLHYAFYKLDNPDDCSQMDPIEFVTMLTSGMKNKGIDTADKDGRTPLHVAAFRGATISFTHLTELVTNLDAADTLGNTALSLAVAGGHDSITVPLIQRGANINVPVTNITPEYKEWEKWQKELKGKKKIWTWEKRKPVVPTKVNRVSVLYKVVEKGWQGVLYLLMDRLERFGLPKTAVVQATLEAGKMHLAHSLIMKKMKNWRGKDLLNTSGQNMLHVLALNSKGESTNEHIEVAKALLSQGNTVSSLDSYGCSALTYAVLARDLQLCRVFIDETKSNIKNVLSNVDGEKRSGFSAFFYSTVWDATARQLWELLSRYGLSPNEMYLMPDWSQAILDHGSSTSKHHLYHVWDPPVIRQTPFMSAIKTRNFELVKYLLNNGADVNTSDPLDNTTPLMAAVQTNDANIVKLLLNKDFDPGQKAIQAYNKSAMTFGGFGASIWKGGKAKASKRYSDDEGSDEEDDEDDEDEESDMDVDEEEEEDNDKKKKTEDTFKMTSKVNLTAVDSNNRNVFHHLITGEEGTYENVDLLNTLAKFAPATLLTSQDLTGHSPLDLAVEARADKLISAMEKITKQKVKRLDKVTHKWTDGIKWKFPNRQYDFKSDAEEMLKKINALDESNQSDEEKKPKAKVDHRVGQSSGVEVVVDTDQDIPYSVLMTKVDVKYGVWGMNNFYKMQVVHQKGKDMYLLFTCWGRIGDEGQNQRTPFGTAAEAIKEFCKIFASKSGNTWANVKQFNRIPGKYQLVDADPHSSKKAVKEFHFDLKSSLPSELPTPLQDLLKTLTSVPILNAVLKRSNVNTALMPFGQLKENVIKEAKDILDKVRTLNQDLKKELDANTLSDDGAQKMSEVLELSSRYYQLIPYTDFAFDKMEPLNKIDALKDAEKNMQNLVDLELANRILLGAQYRINEINPLDYIYQALDCQIELMDETSTEAQMILQQINNTCENTRPSIEAIYRIARHGEEEDLYKLNLSNHQLLWHGTKTSNLVSILKRGLLTQPVESSGYTGNLYGRGIYTAPMVAKSMNYCTNFYERAKSKFLLLCEVAVGKSQTDVEETGFRKGFDSTLGQGSRGPDPNFDFRLKSGASIPLGKTITKPNTSQWLSFDEIVLYSEEQVCLRYLVQFR